MKLFNAFDGLPRIGSSGGFFKAISECVRKDKKGRQGCVFL